MCYNSDCRIKIKSCIDGEISSVSAKGTVIKTNSHLRFDYFLDGDECALVVTDGEVIQSRRGGQNIKIAFRKGKQTECVLESGGFSGSFFVFTDDLKCTTEKTDSTQVFTLLIDYTLGEQKTELNFSAEYKF